MAAAAPPGLEGNHGNNVPTSITSPSATSDRTTPPVQPDDVANVRAKDEALALALEELMRDHRPYLDPALKLSHLARALGVSEYRISQAIREVLGRRNVNQYINTFRIDHARTLLANPDFNAWSTLVVGLESGFGSLAAFHRAFKAAEHCTPGEYRSACRGKIRVGADYPRLDRDSAWETAL